MNHDSFDDELRTTLQSLVADADSPPTLRANIERLAGRHQLRRWLVPAGSIAAAVIRYCGFKPRYTQGLIRGRREPTH